MSEPYQGLLPESVERPVNEAQAELFPGYRVLKLEEKEEFDDAYQITGPKLTFRLCRNGPNLHMLFVNPFSSKTGKIRGYRWFTDKGGALRPVK